jgi:hypothetical protein
VDSTETPPDLPADQHAANHPPANPGAAPAEDGMGEISRPADPAMAADAPGETVAAAGPGTPRPRRRRRRRRPATAAAAGGEAGSSQSDAADVAALAETGEAPPEPATATGTDGSEGAATDGAAAAPGGEPSRPVLRLRQRNRRRRRPAMPGLLPGHSDPAATAGGTPPAIAEIRAALAPGQRSFSVPRRQRRYAPLSGTPNAASGAGATASEGGVETSGTPSRPRRRRRRGPAGGVMPEAAPATTEAGSATESGGEAARRHHRGGSRRGEEARQDGGRERHGDRRERGRDRGERRERGGKGAPPKRAVEQKLYSVDAIVDRGFEDVEEEGGETRRVHWTIVKRTTADQISRKPVATLYVLQRDGVDTEFPTLGTARSAVNKTIVHPEKLTPSKAERAIAKK